MNKLIEKFIARMHSTITKVLIVLASVSCQNLNDKKEFNNYFFNQNGDLKDFYATEKYCDTIYVNNPLNEQCLALFERANKNHRYIQTLKDSLILVDSIFVLEISIISDSTYEEVRQVYYSFIEFTGGFCYNGFPVLPNRTIDAKNFWSNKENFRRIENSILKFNKALPKYKSIGYINIDNLENELRNNNNLYNFYLLNELMVKVYEKEKEVLQIKYK